MKDSLFQEYSREHVHFYDEELPFLLESGLALTNKAIKKPSIVDLGCGDGRLIFALHKRGLLKNVGEIVGVDISEDRMGRLKKELPFVKGMELVLILLSNMEFLVKLEDYEYLWLVIEV